VAHHGCKTVAAQVGGRLCCGAPRALPVRLRPGKPGWVFFPQVLAESGDQQYGDGPILSTVFGSLVKPCRALSDLCQAASDRIC